jgi:hypothetical protein
VAHTGSWTCPNYGARTPRCPVSRTEVERNCSVARPLPCPWAQASWICYEIGPLTAYGGSSGTLRVCTLGMQACSVYSPRRSRKPIPRVRSSLGLAQAQPADIYSPSPHTHPGAAFPLYNCRKYLDLERLLFPFRPTSYHAHSSPWRMFLNSTFHALSTYQLPVGITPTRPRHNP